MRDADLSRLAAAVQVRDWRVASAESVTAGLVATHLARGPSASEWFLGSVVAYGAPVKTRLLGVPEGPVVTAAAAQQMARGVAELLGAQVAVATTGVGGPGPQEGKPAGTVWVGLCVDGDVTSHLLRLPGDPGDVCAGAARQAIELLVRAVVG